MKGPSNREKRKHEGVVKKIFSRLGVSFSSATTCYGPTGKTRKSEPTGKLAWANRGTATEGNKPKTGHRRRIGNLSPGGSAISWLGFRMPWFFDFFRWLGTFTIYGRREDKRNGRNERTREQTREAFARSTLGFSGLRKAVAGRYGGEVGERMGREKKEDDRSVDGKIPDRSREEREKTVGKISGRSDAKPNFR